MCNPRLWPATAVWCPVGLESGAKPANPFQAAKCEWRWRRLEPGESERSRRWKAAGQCRWRNPQHGRSGEGGESGWPPGAHPEQASRAGGRVGETIAGTFPKYPRPLLLPRPPQCQPWNPEMATAWTFQEKLGRDDGKARAGKWNYPCTHVSL